MTLEDLPQTIFIEGTSNGAMLPRAIDYIETWKGTSDSGGTRLFKVGAKRTKENGGGAGADKNPFRPL